MTLTVALATTGTVTWGVATMVTSMAITTMEALQLLHLPQAQAEGHHHTAVTLSDQKTKTEASKHC